MPELHEVIEALARSAAHSPSWTQADSELIAEWIEDEKPVSPKTTHKAGSSVSTGGK